MSINNAILIYPEAGIAKHRFCTEEDARAFLEKTAQQCENASMFVIKGNDAKQAFTIFNEIRERVAAAKTALLSQMLFKDALDRQGVPLELDLRTAIFKAFSDIKHHSFDVERLHVH
jgi:hypothetical protein